MAFGDVRNQIEQMLNTRMLFSCLVDADYSVSALEGRTAELEEEQSAFDPQQVLEALYRYQESLAAGTASQSEINRLRTALFWRCGDAGASADGLCNLTAPTGTGKTLALLHFALQQCITKGKSGS